jgi:hypothetical protein
MAGLKGKDFNRRIFDLNPLLQILTGESQKGKPEAPFPELPGRALITD